jgi:hypothetical protein
MSPAACGTWSEAKRRLGLDTAASIFKMIYKDADFTAETRDLFKVGRGRQLRRLLVGIRWLAGIRDGLLILVGPSKGNFCLHLLHSEVDLSCQTLLPIDYAFGPLAR